MRRNKFTFKKLHPRRCEYPIPVSYTADGYEECSEEEAEFFGWWGDEIDEGWYLCAEHLDKILESERK